LRVLVAQRQHGRGVEAAATDDQAAQPAPALHQVGPPVLPGGNQGGRGKAQRQPAQGGAQQLFGRARIRPRQPGAIQGRQRRHPGPDAGMGRPGAELVIEQRPREQPEQHRVGRGHGDAGHLRGQRHPGLEQRRRADHLHAQPGRQRHPHPGQRRAGPVAAHQQPQHRQLRQQAAAQGGVGQGVQQRGVGHGGGEGAGAVVWPAR